MSTPSPLQSPGTLDGAASPKSRVRITVLTILALHVVVIGGLLLQGCDKGGKGAATAASNTVSSLPPLVPDTNYFNSFPGDAPATAAAGAGGATAPAATGAGGAPLGGGPPAPPASFAQDPVGAGAGAHSPAGVAANPSAGLPPIPSGSIPAPGAAAAAPASSGTEHVIKKGDTIGGLAKKYGVTEQAIIDANPQSKPRNLKINERLSIPAPAPAAPAPAAGAGANANANANAGAAAAPAESGEVYIVKQGDTLTKVAKKFGVTVKQLRAANSIKGDRIVPKQRLNIPARAPATAGAASSN